MRKSQGMSFFDVMVRTIGNFRTFAKSFVMQAPWQPDDRWIVVIKKMFWSEEIKIACIF